MSIPEVLRQCRRDAQFNQFSDVIHRAFPIRGQLAMRQVSEDPLARDFIAWADDQSPVIPNALRTICCRRRCSKSQKGSWPIMKRTPPRLQLP
jgi:hypothetical protein